MNLTLDQWTWMWINNVGASQKILDFTGFTLFRKTHGFLVSPLQANLKRAILLEVQLQCLS